jgi:molybdenum cofactor cytidylyltransferase
VIAAIVLAAGESRRMGTQKLLLPFGDTTVVGAVARAAGASRADRVVVVLGADRDAVRAACEPGAVAPAPPRGAQARAAGPGTARSGPRSTPLEARPMSVRLSFTVNEGYMSGMLSSVQAGFRALPEDAEAAVVILGDQPFLRVSVVDAVVAAYREGGRGIVIPVFRGRRGHPVLVDMKYRDEVLGLDPSDGLRRLMRAHPDDVREVEVDDAGILRDLDTPQDYKGIKDGVRSTFYPKTGKR